MRVLLQRVSEASVVANGELTGEINTGLLLLVGVEDADTEDDIIVNLKDDMLEVNCRSLSGLLST